MCKRNIKKRVQRHNKYFLGALYVCKIKPILPMTTPLLPLPKLNVSPRQATLDFICRFARTYQPQNLAQC